MGSHTLSLSYLTWVIWQDMTVFGKSMRAWNYDRFRQLRNLPHCLFMVMVISTEAIRVTSDAMHYAVSASAMH